MLLSLSQLVETSRGSGQPASHQQLPYADQPSQVQPCSPWNCSSPSPIPWTYCSQGRCRYQDPILPSYVRMQQCLQEAQVCNHCIAMLCSSQYREEGIRPN